MIRSAALGALADRAEVGTMPKLKTRMPIEARTFDQVCRLPRDNVMTERYGILLDGEYVWLSNQAMGELRVWGVKIPKRDFDKLVRWYMLGVVPRSRRPR